MTSRATALEQFTEEFNRVDQELKLLQKDLEDTLQLNDNFQKSIEQKGEELAGKDEYLMTLREKNAAEIEQLLLEEASSKENFTHEINFHTVELHNLRIKKQRLEELREENRRLHTSLQYLEDQTNKDRLQHALAMHDMNKEMKLLRQQMEQKLRKELAGLELSFQEEAFSALQDKQKKAMLENAKLKDEVALQGVGIANLTARLIKQQLAYDKCKKVLTKYEKKSHVLRERLADATMFKNNLLKLRENYLKEEHELLQEKEKLTHQLHINSIASASATATATATATNSANPSIINHETTNTTASTPHHKSPRKHGAHRYAQTMMVVSDLITRYLTAKDTYRSLLTTQKVWINRYDSMKNIFLDLRAMNDSEENGNYQKKYFPLQELIQEIITYIQQQQIIDPAIMLRKLPVSTAIAAAASHSLSSSNPKFSKFDRPLTPAVQSENSSVTGGAISTTSTTQGSEVLFEIQKIIKQDADLSEALKHLKGKESSILTAFQENKNDEGEGDNKDDQKDGGSVMSKRDEDKDQNMIAWTVLKIISLWFGVEEKVERGVFTIDEESDDEMGENEEDLHDDDNNSNNALENSDIIWPPLHEETNLTNEIQLDDYLQNSSVEKYSSVSTNSLLQEPDYYEQHQQQPHATFQLSEEELQREEENMNLMNQRNSLETIDEWEAKMLNDIQKVREEENAKKLISDKKLRETGIGYYDQPPETSTWLYKVPPRPSKHFVFTNEIKEKLVPRTSSLSVRETTAYRKEALKLADVGPPIIIHEFLSPLARPSSTSLSSPNPPTRAETAKSSDLHAMTLQSNTLTSLNSKPRLQRKESQILHYDSERDPLLFNQKKKNLNLPKSPTHMAMTTESVEPHSIYKKEFISDRALPRKLQIALSKTVSVPLLLPNSKPNTPALPPTQTLRGLRDPLLGKKKNHGGKKGLSHSTGALLSMK